MTGWLHAGPEGSLPPAMWCRRRLSDEDLEVDMRGCTRRTTAFTGHKGAASTQHERSTTGTLDL
ncbi:MAG: hypothetical protein QOE71_137 [Pseudonocardiales bacterium]|nr:hypothetical protein [Pseudonocardiales bacterium]